jgi:hypothetical protein
VAFPPPKPPPKLGLAKSPPSNEDVLARAKREKDELAGEAQAVEEELEALKARYDQYFLGIERREPNRWREELKKKVLRLKSAFTRNTGLKFKIQSLHARFISYERLWMRSAREKEEGTYRRDLFKARLRHHDEAPAADAAEAPPAPPPAKVRSPKVAAPQKAVAPKAGTAEARAPVAAVAAGAKPPASAQKAPPPGRSPASGPPPPAGGMNETQMRALYNAYLAAKMTCREDVSKLTYDAVARTVSKQIPELMTRYKAKSVDFKVEVKDGKAVLKAIPKV